MRIRTVLLASILLLASGCGGDATEPEPVAPPVTPITGAGGTVTSADGKATLIIPAGALATPTTITITPAALSHARLVPGTAYTFEPDGLQFAVPARLTIRYDSIPAALADQTAFVWLHRRNGNDWDPMVGEPVDTVNRIIAGEIAGFSQYGGATSSLAADVLQVGLQLSAMLTNTIASTAVALDTSVANLLKKQSDPAFQVLVQPFLQAAYSTACTAYTTALGIGRDAPVTDYGEFTELMAPALYWSGVVQTLGGGVPCPGSVNLLAAMLDRKFQQFVEFYVTRLNTSLISSSFDKLADEARFILTLRNHLQALDLEPIEVRLYNDAQLPLLDAMRAAAYGECRDNGIHEYLGTLVPLDGIASFTTEDIWDDLQYCATRVDWQVASTDGSLSDNGSMGGAMAPGTVVSAESGLGIATGTITLGGTVRAFECPGGSLENDQFVVTLQGMEVYRGTASGGDLFASPLQLDAASILNAAGVDPSQSAVVPLVLARESAGCGLYVQTSSPFELVTLQLGYPPPFRYFTDFSSGAGPEWSPGQTTIAPAGEKHLGTFNNTTATLSLGNLPAHTEAIVEFDFYAIQSLDGNNTEFGPDIIEFRIAGAVVKRTSFTNVFNPAFTQAYPGDYPSSDNVAGAGAANTNSLGYPPNAGQYSDAVYHIVFKQAHTAGNLTFAVSGSGMDQWEGWGLDNVRVTVH